MSNVYVRAQQKATAKLKERGIQFQIVTFNSSNNEVVLTGDVFGILGPVTEENGTGQLIEEAEGLITATNTELNVDTTMYARFNNILYKILSAKKVTPTDTTILQQFFVRS